MFVVEPKQRLLSRGRVLTRSSRPSSTHSRLFHNLPLIQVSLSFYASRFLGHNDFKTSLTTTNTPGNATFIGLTWDLVQRHVYLPDQKRMKFLRRVQTFIASFNHQKCTLHDIDKIHGSLCYLTVVYLGWRSRLASLSNLRWWEDVLSKEDFYRQLTPRGPASNLCIYTDASTSWGIGVIIDGRWKAFRLSDNWKTEGRGICWLETLGVEFVVYLLEAMGISNCQVTIHSDNQGTIGSMGKRRSPNYHINLSIRRSYSVLLARSITPSLVYVASADNPADPISRGELGKSGDILDAAFELPEELTDVFAYVY